MKNKSKIASVIIALALIMISFCNGCGTKTKKKKNAKKQIAIQVLKIDPLVKQPFSKVNVPYQEIIIDADSGKTFTKYLSHLPHWWSQ